MPSCMHLDRLLAYGSWCISLLIGGAEQKKIHEARTAFSFRVINFFSAGEIAAIGKYLEQRRESGVLISSTVRKLQEYSDIRKGGNSCDLLGKLKH
mmetsp:Transcript_5746/g.6391  ORF Transcript_5746/g.6391 Transcript_5746/m.6391 type:complete len:96 (+) Transcript_5746:76-363(+)